MGVVADRAPTRAAPRDDRLRPAGTKIAAQAVGVVAAIGDQPLEPAGGGEQGWSRLDVGDIAGRQMEADRPAQKVGDQMQLGGAPAARGADRLRPGPPFPPAAERCALM